jgi:hypothetical protein
MANDVETQTCTCPTHGVVEASREIPRLQFPFVYYGVKRWMAKRRPFLCPQCGEPFERN